MTVLYSRDFESDSHLATLAAFTTSTGANWIVLGSSYAPSPAARGTNRYGSADNGDLNYYNGNTSLGNQAIRTASKIVSGNYVAHVLRMNTTTRGRYHIYPEWNGTHLRVNIVEHDGSSTIQTVSSSYDVAYAAGDVLHMESSAVGTTIETRIWVNSASRPSSPTATLTDATYATGAVGLLRVLGSGTYGTVDDLVITDAAGGENTFYPGASGPTISAHPSNTSVATGAAFSFSVTAAASGGGTLSYQWQKNGSNISGATSSTYGGTAGTDGVNGDVFRCVVTETGGSNAGSTNSNNATLTVTAASGKSSLNFSRHSPNRTF